MYCKMRRVTCKVCPLCLICAASSSSGAHHVGRAGEKYKGIFSINQKTYFILDDLKIYLRWQLWLACFSLKERLPLVLTFWLCLIIMKFLVLFFSLLLVLAYGFSFVRFLTNSFLSVRPAFKSKTHKDIRVRAYKTDCNPVAKTPSLTQHFSSDDSFAVSYHCCCQSCLLVCFRFFMQFLNISQSQQLPSKGFRKRNTQKI